MVDTTSLFQNIIIIIINIIGRKHRENKSSGTDLKPWSPKSEISDSLKNLKPGK